MLHVDPLTLQEFARLDSERGAYCVSIYLPTHPVSRDTPQDKILFKNLTKQAVAQLGDCGADKGNIAAIADRFDRLAANTPFWNHAAEGLVVFATLDQFETWRLPRPMPARVEVADRFYLKPLISLLTLPREALLLQLSEAAARLWLVTESNFTEVSVPAMPADFDTAMQNRTGAGAEVRMRQKEDVKVRLQQYVSDIETAMRPVLRTLNLPLLLAGVELLVSYYRHADTYPRTIGEAIVGNQDNRPTKAIAEEARAILRRWYDDLVTSWLARVDDLQGEGLATTDLSQIARATEDGRIETLVVDVETHIPGRITNGVIVEEAKVGAATASYDILDELAGRTFRQGGRVLGVSSGRIPRGAKAAAVFRYAL